MYTCTTIKQWGVYRQADSFVDQSSAIGVTPTSPSATEEEPKDQDLAQVEEDEKFE